MSRTRSAILVAARRAGRVWESTTAEATKTRLADSHTPLYEALEALSKLTNRGETSHEMGTGTSQG